MYIVDLIHSMDKEFQKHYTTLHKVELGSKTLM